MAKQGVDLWPAFDAALPSTTSDPWSGPADTRVYTPEYDVLRRLLEVPLGSASKVQSGWHAKAVDAWIAHELRRSGFGTDEVWPRADRPRVLPREVALLLDRLPGPLAADIRDRLSKDPMGVVGAEASVLGKAYSKQIDVLISQWARGPELMISTKRMQSSLANNALNRIEESYGDAHNLRGRHPLAAIGYVLVVREQALKTSPASAARLLDLLDRMAHDPAGYDATAVMVVEWDDDAGVDGDHSVRLVPSAAPQSLGVERFLATMVRLVVSRTPVDTHVAVREQIGWHVDGFWSARCRVVPSRSQTAECARHAHP